MSETARLGPLGHLHHDVAGESTVIEFPLTDRRSLYLLPRDRS